jgi:hypothetical protein
MANRQSALGQQGGSGGEFVLFKMWDHDSGQFDLLHEVRAAYVRRVISNDAGSRRRRNPWWHWSGVGFECSTHACL